MITFLSNNAVNAINKAIANGPAAFELARILDESKGFNARISVDVENGKIVFGSGISLELTGNSTRLRLVDGCDLLFDGTTGQSKVIVPDNLANALEFRDASGNEILRLISTTGGMGVYVPGAASFGEQATFLGARGAERVIPVSATPHTVEFTDSGKIFYTTIADVVFNLPSSGSGALTGLEYTFVNGSLSGGTGLSVSPGAVDQFQGKGITPADDKDYINSGATDALGDLIKIHGMADGWLVTQERGTWAREA